MKTKISIYDGNSLPKQLIKNFKPGSLIDLPINEENRVVTGLVISQMLKQTEVFILDENSAYHLTLYTIRNSSNFEAQFSNKSIYIDNEKNH